jgi:hypothetical protein
MLSTFARTGLSLLLALCALTATAAEPLPALAVISFELVDDQPDPVRDADHKRRLVAIQAQLQQGLHQRGLYRVIDTAPVQAQIDALHAQNAYLYRCNGCFADVGQRLGARLVAVGWVQRVSELILNVNVSVRDAETDKEVLSKSVDLRGNNDESWSRAMAFMLRDWSERRERNPRYGQ